jgi:hypothetical protein
MRVVEADDGEAARARTAASVDVRLGIQKVAAHRVDGKILAGNRFDDLGGCSDEQPAAFLRRGGAGVRRDRLERERRHAKSYNASTAIAMPMPPPMQSDATPYRSLRALNAYTSVVNMRAPLAPIG